MSTRVLTVGPNNGTRTYRSVRATSRVLSGNGSNSLRNTIIRRLSRNGGSIGDVWVQPAKSIKR